MKRLAVVEDNADNRLLLQALLDDVYDIVEYETGSDALEGIKESPPDVVLLDISLPQMDGVDVLRYIRADPVIGRILVCPCCCSGPLARRSCSGSRRPVLSGPPTLCPMWVRGASGSRPFSSIRRCSAAPL